VDDANLGPTTTRFRAFISYSHADRATADWLHRALETYRLPRELPGAAPDSRNRSRRIAPVFLDRVDLSASDDLAADVSEALNASETLIVICSPSAARSTRVSGEIEQFRAARSGGRILALLVDGRPNAQLRDGDPADECLPPPLRRSADGGVREGFFADLRPGKGSRRDALLRLAAGILDVDLDVLRRRDQQRERGRWVAISSATIAGMVVTSGLAVHAWRAEAHARLEADTARQVSDFLVRTFDVVRPRDRDGNRVLVREVLDNGARELRTGLIDQPDLRARMLETIGRVYRQMGLLEQARPLLTEALELRKSAGDGDPVDLGSALHQVAALEMAADKFEAAEQAAREALAALARSSDPHARAMRAEVLLALGNHYVTRSRFAEADAAIAESLAIRESMFGAASVEAADARLVAARSWREQGDFARATPAVERALQDLEAQYPGLHTDIARGQRELAIIYQERGDFANYDRVARQALDTALKLYGQESPQISSYVELAANAAFTNRRMDEAISGMRRVLELRRAALGVAHTRTGYAHYNLGFMLGDNGRIDEAMPHLIEAQRIWEAAFGVQHPDVAYALDAQARYLRMQGRLRSAEPLVRRALAINESASGPDHPTTARSVLNLANWLRDSGRLEESRPLYDRAERIRVTAFGADSAYVAEVREDRAALEAVSRALPADKRR
jgi:tetratricopeptide (TPR) repeat protein